MNYYSHDLRSEGFVPVTLGCAEKGKETFGPEVGIAEYLNEKYAGEEFFIVKCAFGSSGIFCGDWRSPSIGEIGDYEATKHSMVCGPHVTGWCYNELIHILGESIHILTEMNYQPAFCGFCWMQGESDAMPLHSNEFHSTRFAFEGVLIFYDKLKNNRVPTVPCCFLARRKGL